MDYLLIVVKGRSANTTLKLNDGVTLVGRHDDCQLRIKSSQVSRRHCEIFEKKGLLLVKDLGSSNGTYVNGKRIQQQQVLEPGDELLIGQVKLRVTKPGASAPTATPAPARKPGDTAIGGEAAAAPEGGDEDFDIEFDESLGDSAAVLLSDDDLAPPPADAPKTPTPAPVAKTQPKPKPEPKTEPAPAPKDSPAEDAIADFLLDIKFDDDE